MIVEQHFQIQAFMFWKDFEVSKVIWCWEKTWNFDKVIWIEEIFSFNLIQKTFLKNL